MINDFGLLSYNYGPDLVKNVYMFFKIGSFRWQMLAFSIDGLENIESVS